MTPAAARRGEDRLVEHIVSDDRKWVVRCDSRHLAGMREDTDEPVIGTLGAKLPQNRQPVVEDPCVGGTQKDERSR